MTRLYLSLIIKVVAVGLISLYHAPLFLDLLGEEWGPVVGVSQELQIGWLVKRVISATSAPTLKSIIVLQGMSLFYLKAKLAKLRPLISFLTTKAFALCDSGSALSRSAFFVNQVTCIWALPMLMAVVELGQGKVSVHCECVCFGRYFPQLKGMPLFKLSSTTKSTWVSLCFTFLWEINFFLTGTPVIHRYN